MYSEYERDKEEMMGSLITGIWIGIIVGLWIGSEKRKRLNKKVRLLREELKRLRFQISKY